jgi:hypothetical protein
VDTVAIMLALLGGSDFRVGAARDAGGFVVSGSGGLFLAIAATILFRGYIPHWIFDFQVALMQFGVRGLAYLALLTDRYPAFESEYPVNLEVDYPEHPTRWKVVIWKLITAVPHFVVLFFLIIVAGVMVLIAWFAILFTGQYPRGLHDFVSGAIRWGVRVNGYVLSLTDVYPPFSTE